MSAELLIRDELIEVGFDAVTGGVVRFHGHGAIAVGGRAALFVVEVPRGGDRTVVVATPDQRLSSARPADDGSSLVLRWDDPVTSAGERLAGSIRVRAAAVDGALELSLEYEFADAAVEAVRFPALRGIVPPEGGTLEYRGVDYSTGTRVRLLPVFDNNSPYWGTTYPDYASGNLRPEVVANPTSPFAVLASESGGLMVMPTSPTPDVIGWRTSLEPGYWDSMSRTAGPADAAAVAFEAIHFPADPARAGLPSMTVAPYLGDWTAALGRYRKTQGASRVSSAAWLGEPRSWLQVQLMSTEGEARYDFGELLEIVEECAAAGIGAIQIVGWNEGGQDGLVPVHRPAAKLGGEAGLRRALDRARELDVAAVLYVKYQWVEKPGPFWEELERFVCRDPNGQPYAQPGPVYHSSRKRYGISTPWYVPLCFGATEVRSRFAAEVRTMADWGAAGILADESLYHGRALLCFATDHGHRPGTSTYSWDGDFVDDLRAAAGDRSDEFVIAAEGAYDAQFEHYDVSYFRSFSEGHIPSGRRLRPGTRIVTALTGFDDRNMANQCLVYGYAASLEPFNFKGRPRDMPRTVAYVGAVDRLRSRFAAWLWDGELVDDPDVAVVPRQDGPGAIGVWRRPEDGSQLVVIANYAPDAREFEVGGVPPGLAVIVGADERAFEPGVLRVPGRSAVVLIPSALATR